MPTSIPTKLTFLFVLAALVAALQVACSGVAVINGATGGTSALGGASATGGTPCRNSDVVLGRFPKLIRLCSAEMIQAAIGMSGRVPGAVRNGSEVGVFKCVNPTYPSRSQGGWG